MIIDFLCTIRCLSRLALTPYSKLFRRVIDINFNGIDVNNQGRSCLDWQLKSQFDTDPNECVNYNAIGAMCGCPNNEPHPDACGPLVSSCCLVLSLYLQHSCGLTLLFLYDVYSVEKGRWPYTVNSILCGIIRAGSGISCLLTCLFGMPMMTMRAAKNTIKILCTVALVQKSQHLQ